MDVELVERAKHGDQAAFESLVRAAVGRLSMVARLMLTDTDVADDAVQETLVQSWRDLRGLRDPARFHAWTHRILVRNVIREARRERRHRVTAIQADDLVAGTSRSPSDVDDRDEIERGLRRISPDLRIVLVLHHYLGLDGPAAASVAMLHQESTTSATIIVIDADDPGPSAVTFVKGLVDYTPPDWSPDGRWLFGAATSDPAARFEDRILLLDPTGIAEPVEIDAPDAGGTGAWQRLAP